MNNVKKVKKAVLELIRTHEQTNYVEIEMLFEQIGFDYEGNHSWFKEGYENIILWEGWNREAFEIIGDLLAEGVIELVPVDISAYCDTAGFPCLPLAKTIKEYKKYKEPRWLPLAFIACEPEKGNRK